LTHYRITIRAEGQGPPAIIRLRRFLKALLRVAGLRAVEVLEMPEGPGGAPGQVRPGGARGPMGQKGA
jgi:hypothetical protein